MLMRIINSSSHFASLFLKGLEKSFVKLTILTKLLKCLKGAVPKMAATTLLHK